MHLSESWQIKLRIGYQLTMLPKDLKLRNVGELEGKIGFALSSKKSAKHNSLIFVDSRSILQPASSFRFSVRKGKIFCSDLFYYTYIPFCRNQSRLRVMEHALHIFLNFPTSSLRSPRHYFNSKKAFTNCVYA